MGVQVISQLLMGYFLLIKDEIMPVDFSDLQLLMKYAKQIMR